MEIAKRIHKSQFLRQNATLFIGTLFVSILNYLYYPILSRLLEVRDYGEVQVLVSFFLQLMMLLMVLTQVTTNIVANGSDEARKQGLIFELEKLALLVGLGVVIGGSLSSWLLMQMLQFQSPLPFIILLVAFIVTIPFTFRSGYLRARQRFWEVSVGSIIGSLGKVVVSTLLVLWGFGTSGAIGGLVVAQLLALVYTIWQAQRNGFFTPAESAYFRLPHFTLIAPEVRYFTVVLAGSLAVTMMYSIDVILVKYYFTPNEAGLYAAVATIARIIFFLTISIAQVLMPAVKMKARPSENKRVLLKSTLLVAAIGGVAWLFIALFPAFVMQTLMGTKYLAYAYLLPELSMAVFVISLFNLFVAYHLALRHYGVSVVAVSGAIGVVSLIVVIHDSPLAVVRSLLLGSIAAMILLGIWLAMHSYRQANRRRKYA